MKIIFLDIDGVLNSNIYDARRNWGEQTDIDESRLPLVKKIVDETGARIVLSSTWREHWDRSAEGCDADGVYINKTFEKFGLEIFDKTPDLGREFDRPDEVAAWLSVNGGVESFVIIDDYRYAWGKLADNFVKTNPNFGFGLEEEHVQKAIKILSPEIGYNKLKVSILGDSISTYAGFNPYGYPVYYSGGKLTENELLSVDDTWWKKVIDKLGGVLCVNNSYSGSLICGDNETCGCSEERCSRLHNEDMPDAIFIFMGTNDRGYEVGVQKFYEAYRTMLQRVKKNYPAAKIVCATLLLGYIKSIGDVTDIKGIVELDYNNAIRKAVKDEGCLLADIAASGKCYETLDGCHPTKNGHKLIADLWLKCLNKIFFD